ncbi:MAG TPA: ABC transporter substrate-binding protein [Stellaceae bacterium]|nr:ABC transporter substrate-binding protein [Stellaceae bacterium]
MRFLSYIAAAAILAASLATASADPLNIRVAWVVVPNNLPPILFAKPGIAHHQAQSYTMDAIRFSGTPQMISAFGANEIDIALLAYSSLAVAIENAGMSDLRVIADAFQDGAPGYYTDEYMVLKDSPIQTVADLRGKILGSNVTGGAIDVGLRAMLHQHGLDARKDVTIVEVAFPNMRAALGERKVDLIGTGLPFAQDQALRAATRTIFTQREAIGRTEMIVWVARAGFIAAHRPAMVDFMEDVLRALHFFTDPANHGEAVDIVARFNKQPPEYYDAWLFKPGGDYYRDANAVPDLDALQANIRTQVEFGFLKADLEIREYADLSLIKEAAARLAH